MSLKVHYDQEIDVLYIGREGEEEEAEEIYPGVTLEKGRHGELVGIELLNASRLLKNVLEPLQKRALL
ncbi:MAG: DUF2283 domain-containing protein [Clostridia bacterium]|nr:MAG: DUF2283 domain-containing protein [Clostridia bacterium]